MTPSDALVRMLVYGLRDAFQSLDTLGETTAGGVVATVTLKTGERFRIVVESS